MSPRLCGWLTLLLCLVGLGDAIYLTWDHFAFLADPEYGGGLCSTGSACDISRSSGASKLTFGFLSPGIPVALLAVGFYVAFAFFGFWRLREPQNRGVARLSLALAFLGIIYPIVLAVYSIVAQGALCPLCSILYIVNLLLLIVHLLGVGEPIADAFKGVWSSVLSKYTGIAALALLGTVVGGYILYSAYLDRAWAGDVLRSDPIVLVTTDRPTKGPADAPVHVVEVADFECPYCAKLFFELDELHSERPDDFKVTFLHFPLDNACNRALDRPFHKRACALHQLAECADQQGKFFEVARVIFDNQGVIEPQKMRALVDATGIDATAFDACLNSGAAMDAIKADIEQALAAKISGTPVVFVDGYKAGGAKGKAFFSGLIDRRLRAAKNSISKSP